MDVGPFFSWNQHVSHTNVFKQKPEIVHSMVLQEGGHASYILKINPVGKFSNVIYRK